MPVFLVRWPNDDVVICTAADRNDVMHMLDEVADPSDCVIKQVERDIALSFRAKTSKNVIKFKGEVSIPAAPVGSEIGASWKSGALESLYDARIRAEGATCEGIGVHKMVLAARSEYFKTMFAQVHMAPTASDLPVFEVPCDDETLRMFVNVLYTDEIAECRDDVKMLQMCVNLVMLADFVIAESVGHTALNTMVKCMHKVLKRSLDNHAKGIGIEAPTKARRVAAAAVIVKAIQVLKSRKDECDAAAAYFVAQLRPFLSDPDVHDVLESAEFLSDSDHSSGSGRMVTQWIQSGNVKWTAYVLDILEPRESIEEAMKRADAARRAAAAGLASIPRDTVDEANALFDESKSMVAADGKKLLDSAVALNPCVSEYYIHRSGVHQELGDTEAALRDADEAIRIAPFEWKPYENKVELFTKSSNDDGALTTLVQAYDLVQMGDPERGELRGRIHALVDRIIRRLKRKEFLENHSVANDVSGHSDGGTDELVFLEFHTHSEFPELRPGLEDELNQLFYPQAGLALADRRQETWGEYHEDDDDDDEEKEFSKLFQARITDDCTNHLIASWVRDSMEHFDSHRGVVLDNPQNRWLSSQYR